MPLNICENKDTPSVTEKTPRSRPKMTSWQDEPDVLTNNELMLNYALTNDKSQLQYAPELDMIFSVANEGRVKAPIAAVDNKEGDIKDSTLLRGHSYVLCSRSLYFAKEFSSKMSNQRDKVNMEFQDIEPEAFKQVLRYLYKGEFIPTAELVMFTKYAAKKFKLPYMVEKSTEKINELLSDENVNPEHLMMIMDHSEFYNDRDQLNKCLRWVVRNTNKAIKSDYFSKISHQTLTFLLKSNYFNCIELEIFLACKKWAEFQCLKYGLEVSGPNIRRVLYDYDPTQEKIIYAIHFPAIERTDFVEFVAMEDILLKEEEGYKILLFLSKKEVSKHNYEVAPFQIENRSYENIQQLESQIMSFRKGADTTYVTTQYDVSAQEGNKVLKFEVKITSEIAVVIEELTICNQVESEETIHVVKQAENPTPVPAEGTENPTPAEGTENPTPDTQTPPSSQSVTEEQVIKYWSKIELHTDDGPCVIKQQTKTPSESTCKVLSFENPLRLEARQQKVLTMVYTFDVKQESSNVEFVEGHKQCFADNLNAITIQNEAMNMMPFLAIKYKPV